MNQHPKISFSVLIANYNNGGYIADALKSVLNQTYSNWEIIIVDDASVDDSLEILNPFLQDKRIKLFRNESNRGCGYTKKRCVLLASGEICGFLDPDDALTEDALSIMIDFHQQLPDYSLINSTYYECDNELKPLHVSKYPRGLKTGKSYLLSSSGEVSHFATFKKFFYNLTMGIDEDILKAVDQDLYYKLEDVGKIHFIDKPLYFYRIHQGGISTGENHKSAVKWHFIVKERALRRRIGILRQKEKNSSGYITELKKTTAVLAKINKKYVKFLFNSFQFLIRKFSF